MNYIFSPKNNAFYPLSLQPLYEDAGTWPDDGVPVDNSMFTEFTGHPPIGKVRGVDCGMPAWIDEPPPSKQQLIEQAEHKLRLLKIEASDQVTWRQYAVDSEIATPQEVIELNEWKKYFVLLSRIDTSKAPGIDWPISP